MFTIFIVALLVLSTVGAYAVLFALPEGKVAGVGDKVRVDYIGKFDDGRVFDTSLWSVASDEGEPKSLFFSMRGGEDKYKPFEFTVGRYGAITGFDLGVRGMKVGETKTFTVPVDQGYGEMDQALMRTMQLEETLPLDMTMTKEEFRSTFGVDPSSLRNFAHPLLGIKAYVTSYDATKNEVKLTYAYNGDGEVFRVCADDRGAEGWEVKVIGKTSTNITVQHQLSSDDNFKVRGHDKIGVTVDKLVKRDFYIDDVDADKGTFVMNYNPETVGRVLTFTVTLRSIN